MPPRFAGQHYWPDVTQKRHVNATLFIQTRGAREIGSSPIFWKHRSDIIQDLYIAVSITVTGRSSSCSPPRWPIPRLPVQNLRIAVSITITSSSCSCSSPMWHTHRLLTGTVHTRVIGVRITSRDMALLIDLHICTLCYVPTAATTHTTIRNHATVLPSCHHTALDHSDHRFTHDTLITICAHGTV